MYSSRKMLGNWRAREPTTKKVAKTLIWARYWRRFGVSYAGPSSYVTPQLLIAGQVVTSDGRVHPPQLHQQVGSFATAFWAQLVPLWVGFEPKFVTRPEAWTSWIHCCTCGLSVGGTLSSVG